MILRISNSALVTELKNIGVHPGSIAIFEKRAEIEPIKITNVRMPAANILKQEAISSGADCAIHCGCVTGAVEYSDVLLLGSRKQYEELFQKLKPMTFFGLPQLCESLKEFLSSSTVHTTLRDGRVLDYQSMVMMGIVNLTEDSFYEASRQSEMPAMLATVERMISEGAGIIDLGAESTRPGAIPLTPEAECERLLPAIKAIKSAFPDVILSVDTYRASTAKEAILAGADMINDVTAAKDPDMGKVIAEFGVPIILMHGEVDPQTMTPTMPVSEIGRVWDYLVERRGELIGMGVTTDKIIFDPGFGFGKTLELNLALMDRLKELVSLGQPVLIGASRKGSIGKVLGGLPPEDRLYGTIALSCQASMAGAHILRVHDVRENAQAVRMLEAVKNWR